MVTLTNAIIICVVMFFGGCLITGLIFMNILLRAKEKRRIAKYEIRLRSYKENERI